MNLVQFQKEHLSWCQRIGKRSCHVDRNLGSDTCAHCVVKFLNARSRMEKFNIDENTSLVPTIKPITDDHVTSGVRELQGLISTGDAIKQYPVGGRLVIRDLIWEIVDYDTVKVPGKDHTMTLRLFADNYLEKIYSGVSKTHAWSTSTLRNFMNTYFLSNCVCEPLRDAILTVSNKQREVVVKSKSHCCKKGLSISDDIVTIDDKVWLPSLSQLGLSDSDEGDVLNAFDESFSTAALDSRVVVEKFKDSIVPKKYWTRSGGLFKDRCKDKPCTFLVDCDAKVVPEFDVEETPYMVVPFITIG